MSKIVLFGAGKIADVAYFQLTNDSPHEVVAFSVDGEHVTQQEKWGLPVVAFDQVLDAYPPDDFKMLVAVGYQDLNHFRARKYDEAKAKGYELISYVSSRASNFSSVEIGDNCMVLENAVLQPCTNMGNNVFFGMVIIWASCPCGRSLLCCWAGGHLRASVIEPYCFLGVNSTIGHEVTIGRESFIGAGALITKTSRRRVFILCPIRRN
ncbi:MAG: hypothetical protein IPJ20_23855, partial [Flammeovirgaceae bacterium]|nr:hypothetical protein [Flammeovirgaceae bacterium]